MSPAYGGIGRAALKASYTWHYSTQGLPVFRVTTEDRELLPHIFTFSPDCSGVVIFCGTFLSRVSAGSRRLTGGLLCAVRTFLGAKGATIARVCSKYKYTTIPLCGDCGLADDGLADYLHGKPLCNFVPPYLCVEKNRINKKFHPNPLIRKFVIR